MLWDGILEPPYKEGLMISARLTDKDSVDLNNAKSDFTKFYK